MATFLFVYRAPRDDESVGVMVAEAWQGFLDGLGTSLVDAGNPIFERQVVGEGDTETVLGGYSIVAAEDLAAATKLAARCPYARVGGGVEVGEMTLLTPDSVTTTAADHARAAERDRSVDWLPAAGEGAARRRAPRDSAVLTPGLMATGARPLAALGGASACGSAAGRGGSAWLRCGRLPP
jgi:YCII-related domain-containing protein